MLHPFYDREMLFSTRQILVWMKGRRRGKNKMGEKGGREKIDIYCVNKGW